MMSFAFVVFFHKKTKSAPSSYPTPLQHVRILCNDYVTIYLNLYRGSYVYYMSNVAEYTTQTFTG